MKRWKKFSVILLAMVLALAMSVPVSAAMFPIRVKLPKLPWPIRF